MYGSSYTFISQAITSTYATCLLKSSVPVVRYCEETYVSHYDDHDKVWESANTLSGGSMEPSSWFLTLHHVTKLFRIHYHCEYGQFLQIVFWGSSGSQELRHQRMYWTGEDMWIGTVVEAGSELNYYYEVCQDDGGPIVVSEKIRRKSFGILNHDHWNHILKSY